MPHQENPRFAIATPPNIKYKTQDKSDSNVVIPLRNQNITRNMPKIGILAITWPLIGNKRLPNYFNLVKEVLNFNLLHQM